MPEQQLPGLIYWIVCNLIYYLPPKLTLVILQAASLLAAFFTRITFLNKLIKATRCNSSDFGYIVIIYSRTTQRTLL